MKIVVLNGSPKGDVSVTMQYVNYLIKKYPQHEYKLVNISQRIKAIEKNEADFDQILADIRAADGVLWAFPLYILIVHAHYKRFIELVFERGAQAAFAGKYAASLSTSIHFFDHTAHNYIHAICDDLGMRFVESFSPDMTDLLNQAGQIKTAQFGGHFFNAIQTGAVTARQYAPLNWRNFQYEPGEAPKPVNTHTKKVVILHDSRDPASNLSAMVARCRSAFEGDVSVINLYDIDIKASCLGCLQCGANNECAFTGKDGFIDFFRSQVMAADILVYAGTITDRYFSSRWKMFFDRSFFNTHTPVLNGKQLVFVISGPFSQLENLREIFTGFAEYQMANLVGFASDEFGTSQEIDAVLDGMMGRAASLAEQIYVQPATFLGVGGTKLFRDDIYGRLRIVFAADHRAYQRLGFYKTFPQRDLMNILLNTFVAPLLSIRRLRREFDKRVKVQMAAPLKQVVDKV
jgi:multimeric flavodoxin WrbA